MDKVIIFFLGFIIWLVLILYRYKIIQFTGKIEWAEQNLGSGGSYTLVIIFGFVIWIGCMTYALNAFDLFFGGLRDFF